MKNSNDNAGNDDKGKEVDYKVDFLMRKEITFVAIGSIIGALVMQVSNVFLEISYGISNTTLLHILDATSGLQDAWTGFWAHILAATIIGIITGAILYCALKFDVSHLAKGLVFGLAVGGVMFSVSTIIMMYVILAPESPHTALTQQDITNGILVSLVKHVVWGLVMGSITTGLTRRFGANYHCRLCDVAFSNTATLKAHNAHVHNMKNNGAGEAGASPMKRILILGGGYAGIGVLNRLQKQFRDDVKVSIDIVSESNFTLHTPMLPEMATGTIEPRHIATPVRKFCHRARFYQARVTAISLKEQKVTIHRKGTGNTTSVLPYDYLVVAQGSKISFYGNKNVERNALTLKVLDDAITVRNRIIEALENADQERDPDVKAKLMTFVVVGGGFSGVETVGELNSFVRDSVKKYYHSIPKSAIKVILISSTDVILPEVGGLGVLAMSALTKAGVTIYTKSKLTDYNNDIATLDDGKVIETPTLIWAAGSMVDPVIADLDTEHHRSGRIIVNAHLSLKNNPDVFALGDCAFITDPRDGTPYPPTAMHAAQEAKIVSENLANRVRGVGMQYDFIYDTKGFVAKIGSMDGVASLRGIKMQGVIAWFVWKHYYLSMLPTTEKKIRVGFDWLVDMLFPRDISNLASSSHK